MKRNCVLWFRSRTSISNFSLCSHTFAMIEKQKRSNQKYHRLMTTPVQCIIYFGCSIPTLHLYANFMVGLVSLNDSFCSMWILQMREIDRGSEREKERDEYVKIEQKIKGWTWTQHANKMHQKVCGKKSHYVLISSVHSESRFFLANYTKMLFIKFKRFCLNFN